MQAGSLALCPDAPPDPAATRRALFVFVCNNARSAVPTMAWNATGYAIHSQGVSMQNVCAGAEWSLGLLTKPTNYLRHVAALPEVSQDGAQTHVLLMDADTIWAARDVAEVWRKYDCARHGRDLVVSTEMNCWVGRHCSPTDLERYYADVAHSPSYSAFVNSGLIMGTRAEVVAMLRHVIQHSAAYRVSGNFRDQFAVTDYVQNRYSAAALDVHQHLFGSFRVFSPGNELLYRVPRGFLKPNFTCLSVRAVAVSPCVDWTPYLFKLGLFRFDESSCRATRNASVAGFDSELGPKLKLLSADPAIWHESGRKLKYKLDRRAFACAVRRMAATDPLREFWQRFVDRQLRTESRFPA